MGRGGVKRMSTFDTKPVESLKPPYVYYSSIPEFEERVRIAGIPDNLKGVMASFSETTRHHLRSALRSLGLMNDEHGPTERLKQLVNAKGAERTEVLRRILRDTYPYMFSGFDPIRADRKQLAERFRTSAGVTSESTVGRCVDFFRQMMKDAELIEDTSKRNGQSSRYVDLQGSSGKRSTSTPPPLPPYEASWPDDIKRSWFTQREIEVKKMGT
jgi:ABC-type ATPase with predicted acetyltransferase domain